MINLLMVIFIVTAQMALDAPIGFWISVGAFLAVLPIGVWLTRA
jgi:hypothetical protein